EAGAGAMDLKRGIDAAVIAMTASLKAQTKKAKGTEEVAQIATVSANGDETVGKMLADAFEKVSKNGVVTVEEAKGLETEIEIVEGMQFDRGYLSPYFVTDPQTLTCDFEDAYILVHEKKLASLKDLIPVAEAVKDAGAALLIIAED